MKKQGKRKATAAKSDHSQTIDSPSPPPARTAEELRALFAAPTLDELIAETTRFMSERAPGHPEEAMQFGLYVAHIAEACAPAMERLKAILSQVITQQAPDAGETVN